MTFFLALCGAAIFFLMSRFFRMRRPSASPRGVLALACLASGLAVLSVGLTPTPSPDAPGSVSLARDGVRLPAQRFLLVQPALPPEARRKSEGLPEVLAKLVELSRGSGPVDVVVWPENALPAYLPANQAILTEALGALTEVSRQIVLGAPRSEANTGRVFNSAFLFRDAARAGFHDKVHPVPFSEYTPPFLDAWFRSAIEVQAAARPGLLAIEGAELGPMICYELLFPDVALAQVRRGADLLLNLSHDGYFGGTAGALQHLAAAPLRAVELRRPLLRATSDGITVAIDSGGRVMGRLPPRESAVLAVDVVPRSEMSIYVAGGWCFAWLAVLFACGSSLRDAVRKS